MPLLDATSVAAESQPNRPMLVDATLEARRQASQLTCCASMRSPSCTRRSYRAENAGALRQDWPRIPLPATRDALLASAELGREVAALLDVEEPVDAVTTGSIRHELRPLGVIATADGGQLDPSAGDLAVTAGWGHAGQGGVTMPGRGRTVERPYTDAELAAFREGLADLGLTYDQLMACLGGTCYDVYLNDVAYWRCVPARVWTYTIGGYQVMKKWLSYRERPLLGRDLQARRGALRHRDDAPHRRHPAARAGARRQLRAGEGGHVRLGSSDEGGSRDRAAWPDLRTQPRRGRDKRTKR